MPEPKVEDPQESTFTVELKPLVYELRLIAYLDVLGWSELVDRSISDPEQLKGLNHAANYFRMATYGAESMRSFFAERNSPDRTGLVLDVTHFSDTLVLSCAAKSFAAHSFISGVQQACHHLLCHGHYMRGAIVLGQVAHQDNVLFGPALIEAIRLERDVAKYPRIIVHPDAIPYVNPTHGTDITNRFVTWQRVLRLDTDGLYYLDILGALAGFQNEPRRKQGTEEHLIALVKAKLVQDAHDLGHLAKHTWMLNYLEEILKECILPVETHSPTKAPLP